MLGSYLPIKINQYGKAAHYSRFRRPAEEYKPRLPIRLTFPKERKRIVVGFTRFCEIVGDLHAEHYSRKALKSRNDVPQFKGQAGRLVVTFYPR